MALFGELADSEVTPAEVEHPSHCLLLVLVRRARQVEVHLARAGLVLLGQDEPDPELGSCAS